VWQRAMALTVGLRADLSFGLFISTFNLYLSSICHRAIAPGPFILLSVGLHQALLVQTDFKSPEAAPFPG